MGETIKHTGNEIKERWTQKMPRFFRQLMVLCVCVAGTAYGINTFMVMAGAMPHEWWTDIYPLLTGVPVGMAIVCKLTVAGGYKDVDPDKLTRHNRILSKDIDHLHGDRPCDGERQENEIEPYDDSPYA